MSPLFAIEECREGTWRLYTVAKSKDDATKGLAAMLRCNPEWPLRVSEFRRVETENFVVERRLPNGDWVGWTCGTNSLDWAREKAEQLAQSAYGRDAEFRVAVYYQGKAAVPPKEVA